MRSSQRHEDTYAPRGSSPLWQVGHQ
jgi:hypothetical protein